MGYHNLELTLSYNNGLQRHWANAQWVWNHMKPHETVCDDSKLFLPEFKATGDYCNPVQVSGKLDWLVNDGDNRWLIKSVMTKTYYDLAWNHIKL